MLQYNTLSPAEEDLVTASHQRRAARLSAERSLRCAFVVNILGGLIYGCGIEVWPVMSSYQKYLTHCDAFTAQSACEGASVIGRCHWRERDDDDKDEVAGRDVRTTKWFCSYDNMTFVDTYRCTKWADNVTGCSTTEGCIYSNNDCHPAGERWDADTVLKAGVIHTVGSGVGSLLSPLFLSYGRRPGLAVAALLSLPGFALLSVGWHHGSYAMILAGRGVTGLGAGVAVVAAPIYAHEVIQGRYIWVSVLIQLGTVFAIGCVAVLGALLDPTAARGGRTGGHKFSNGADIQHVMQVIIGLGIAVTLMLPVAIWFIPETLRKKEQQSPGSSNSNSRSSSSPNSSKQKRRGSGPLPLSPVSAVSAAASSTDKETVTDFTDSTSMKTVMTHDTSIGTQSQSPNDSRSTRTAAAAVPLITEQSADADSDYDTDSYHASDYDSDDADITDYRSLTSAARINASTTTRSNMNMDPDVAAKGDAGVLPGFFGNVRSTFRMLAPFVLPIVAVGGVVQGTGMNSVVNYGPELINKQHVTPLYGNMYLCLLNCLVTPLAIPIVMKLKPRIVYVTCGILTTLACFIAVIPTWIESDRWSAYLGFGAVFFFTVAFAMGVGTCFWIIAIEMFPPHLRPLGTAMTLASAAAVQATFASTHTPLVKAFGGDGNIVSRKEGYTEPEAYTSLVYGAFGLICCCLLRLIPPLQSELTADEDEEEAIDISVYEAEEESRSRRGSSAQLLASARSEGGSFNNAIQGGSQRN